MVSEIIFEHEFYWCNDYSSNIRTPFIYEGRIYYLEFNNTECVIIGLDGNHKATEVKILINSFIKAKYFEKLNTALDKEKFFTHIDMLLRELKLDNILKQI